jgi:hypothetical protein
MNDITAQNLTRDIMTAVGLRDAPSSYIGAGAHQTRIDAAEKLAAKISAAVQAGETISPPVDELVKVVLATAKNLEKPQNQLELTYEVMQVAIFGHIWIGRLIARGAKNFDCIMAKDGTMAILKSLIGFGPMHGSDSCHSSSSDCCSSGGCGSGGCGSGGCGSGGCGSGGCGSGGCGSGGCGSGGCGP